jgi:hypothetical protein
MIRSESGGTKSETIRRVIWILKGLNKHEKVGREKINLLSKIDRFEEERRKKSNVIFWIGIYQK